MHALRFITAAMARVSATGAAHLGALGNVCAGEGECKSVV